MVASARALPPPPSPTPEPQAEAKAPQPLWLCTHFPALALEVLKLDPARPAATVEDHKGRPCLHRVSEAARLSGVEAGMALAAALALNPKLLIRARDAEAERDALNRLAETALEFTPWVSLDQPGSLLLEIGASLGLFGGAENLRENFRQRLTGQAHRPVLAITPSPEASALLARLGVEALVPDRGALRSALGTVATSALPLDEKTRRRIERTGIRCLADLWRLPRDGLARRYGSDFLRWLDTLSGKETRALNAFHRPPRFSESLDMPLELERLDHCFPAIAQLAGEFAAFLKSRDAAASGLVLELLHRGLPATRIELDFRSANRDAEHWLTLLREKLDRSPLPAPVLALRLSSEAIVPSEPEWTDLFDKHPVGSGERNWQAILEQLQARLGRHALKGLSVVDDHRPERAGLEQDAAALPPPSREGLAQLPPRPLWLLAAPEPVETQGLRLLSEPERIESGWWDGASIRRDYRVAQDPKGRKLWIFCDLNRAGQWYLHGLFG